MFVPNRQRARRLAGQRSDAALLAACAAGDTSALGALFDRYRRAVHRFASHVAGAAGMDLDDLVSTTFLEAQRSAQAFHGGSSIKTWLFGIAANVARHQLRGDQRRRAFLGEYRNIVVFADAARPDKSVEQKELLERLDTALRTLPSELRTAFVLCEVEDLPCAEAARALGLPHGTVWKRCRRARKALRNALE